MKDYRLSDLKDICAKADGKCEKCILGFKRIWYVCKITDSYIKPKDYPIEGDEEL